MRMRIALILLLLGLSVVKAEMNFHLSWQIPGDIIDMHVSDLDGDGYNEILIGTGSSHERVINTPTGPGTAMICEGTVSQYTHDGVLVWEKKLCRNDNASNPCYSNGCTSAIYADNICTNTDQLIFVGCCYCGVSSVIRVYNVNGDLLQELYDDDGAGNPVPISGCIRKIFASDIDADNCKEIIAATNLELFIWDTDCQTCTIPQIPSLRTIDLPVTDRPSGTIYDFIVVNFDDDPNLTREIVVAADEVTVYEHDLTLKWQYEIDTSRPVRAIYSRDLDSDTAAHEIDQDPDLEPELVVGESWYIYVLDNIEYGNTDPTDDDPNLKWEYSTSPYDVNTVFAGGFIGPRNVMGGSASLVYVLDYNGSLLQNFNAPDEVLNLDVADFDKNGQNELVVFSNNFLSVFSTDAMLWSSENLQGDYATGGISTDRGGTSSIILATRNGAFKFDREGPKSCSECYEMYGQGEILKEKGDYPEAIIILRQAQEMYEEVGNTYMINKCREMILECERLMEIDDFMENALEQLRTHDWDGAIDSLASAASEHAKKGERDKMSQMMILKEAAEKLRDADENLKSARDLIISSKERNYQYDDRLFGYEYDNILLKDAREKAISAKYFFEDVSNIFLTIPLDSVYETLKLEVSSRIRECEDIRKFCDRLMEAESKIEEAKKSENDGKTYEGNISIPQAIDYYEKSGNLYYESGLIYQELAEILESRIESFKRDIENIDRKIKNLNEIEMYGESVADAITKRLEDEKCSYESYVRKYEVEVEFMGERADRCNDKHEEISEKINNLSSPSTDFIAKAINVISKLVNEIKSNPKNGIAVVLMGVIILLVALFGHLLGKSKFLYLVFPAIFITFLGLIALLLS